MSIGLYCLYLFMVKFKVIMAVIVYDDQLFLIVGIYSSVRFSSSCVVFEYEFKYIGLHNKSSK